MESEGWEYDVQGYYGQGRYAGWETVTAEPTRREALERLKEYRENEHRFGFEGCEPMDS